MSNSITSPPMASPLPLPLDTDASDYSTVLTEDTKSEDEKTSVSSHTDSIGQSSTSSWPFEEDHPASNDELLKHQRPASAESKMSSTWSEDKENVGPAYPNIHRDYANLMPEDCAKTIRLHCIIRRQGIPQTVPVCVEWLVPSR